MANIYTDPSSCKNIQRLYTNYVRRAGNYIVTALQILDFEFLEHSALLLQYFNTFRQLIEI